MGTLEIVNYHTTNVNYQQYTYLLFIIWDTADRITYLLINNFVIIFVKNVACVKMSREIFSIYSLNSNGKAMNYELFCK